MLVSAAIVAGTVTAGALPVAAQEAPAAPKVADACTLLKPRDVKAALGSAPRALRPIRVDQPRPTAPTTGAASVQACALGLLLRKDAGGSVQILTSAHRPNVCPPAGMGAKKTVNGRKVIVLSALKEKKRVPTSAVFAKHGTCVSVAAVLSTGRPVPSRSYVALAQAALRRL
jgi:hypothetical protein